MVVLLALALAAQAAPAPAGPWRCSLVGGDGSVLAFTLGTGATPSVEPAAGSPWPARTVAAQVEADYSGQIYRVDDGSMAATLRLDRGIASEPGRIRLFERQAGESDLPLAVGTCAGAGVRANAVTPHGAGPDLLVRLARPVREPTVPFDCYILTGDGRVTHVVLDSHGDQLTLRPLDANVWQAPLAISRMPMPRPPRQGSIYALSMLTPAPNAVATLFTSALYVDVPARRATMLLDFYANGESRTYGHCGISRIQMGQ